LTVPIGENPEASFGPPNDFKSKYRVIETLGYQSNIDIGQRAQQRLNLTSRELYRYVRLLLRPFYRLYQEVCRYPDKEKGWKTPAIRLSEEFLANEKVDAIISSSSPVTCHIIAKELKKKYSLPWVADFRDLWTQNHAYPYSILRRVIERRLESETLENVDVLVVAASPAAEQLRKLYKGKGVVVITNGFDPERLNERELNLTPKFTITYTGQTYIGKQDPSKLLTALRDLIDEKSIDSNDVDVRFYGPLDESLAKEIKKYRLSAIVKQYGTIGREVAHTKQKESQLLLLFNWEDLKEKGVYTLKVFEYLASQRPILSTGGFGNDVIEALLKETKAGVYCKSTEDIKSTLKVFYLEYKQNGKVNYTGDMEHINKYSYREMAKRFVEILDSLKVSTR
jgi:glycosyltransferase involved in cell wall biosynthesis